MSPRRPAWAKQPGWRFVPASRHRRADGTGTRPAPRLSGDRAAMSRQRRPRRGTPTPWRNLETPPLGMPPARRLPPCQQGVVQAVCLHQQEVHRLPSLSHVDKRAARLRSTSKLARQRDRCCSRCASAAPSTATRQLVDSRAGVNGRGDPVIVVTWIPATWLNCSMLGAVIVIVPIACLKSLRCLSNAMR